MPKKDKRFLEVELKKDLLRWNKLPVEVRISLVKGVDRVRSIRLAIADSAKVKCMPWVRIIDIGWGTIEKGAVFGRAGIFDFGGRKRLGVILPASTIHCVDDLNIRKILVHEFGHCFELATRIINCSDSIGSDKGVVRLPKGDPYDRKRDDSLLVNPNDWFGEEDATQLIHQEDSSLAKATDDVAYNWILKDLPYEEPGLSLKAAKYEIEVDIIEHIRQLRRASEQLIQPPRKDHNGSNSGGSG